MLKPQGAPANRATSPPVARTAITQYVSERPQRLLRAIQRVRTEDVDYLSVEDLLEIAAGVMDQVVLRDAGLLATAAARPRVTAFGDDAYPGFEDQAAALLHSLVGNHALVDGNMRRAWSAARIFCLLNGRDLTCTVDEAEHLMLSATSGQLDVPVIAVWLVAHLEAVSSRRECGPCRLLVLEPWCPGASMGWIVSDSVGVDERDRRVATGPRAWMERPSPPRHGR